MTRLMILAAGWEQERLIQLAKLRGWWVLATSWPASYAHSLAIADVGMVVDPRDLSAVWALAKDHAIDAVTADQCDYSHFAAAFIAERMGLPGATLASAQVATHKDSQRSRLAGSAVPQPAFRICAALSEVRSAIDEIGYPAIIKPIDNRGNFGVNRVDEPGQVGEAFYEALANCHSRRVMVEEFIEGTMATVEGFRFPDGTHLSLVASSKTMLGGRKRVAMELTYPGSFPREVYERLIQTNQVAMEHLAYGVGPTHAEYMVTGEGKPYFIEAANRGGGVLINSHIVPAITGVDTSSLMLDHAVGHVIAPPESWEVEGHAVLSFFGFQEGGRVAAIHGVEEARAVPGVLALRLLVNEGDVIHPISSDASRHGFLIAHAPTRSEALDTIARAKAAIGVSLA